MAPYILGLHAPGLLGSARIPLVLTTGWREPVLYPLFHGPRWTAVYYRRKALCIICAAVAMCVAILVHSTSRRAHRQKVPLPTASNGVGDPGAPCRCFQC